MKLLLVVIIVSSGAGRLSAHLINHRRSHGWPLDRIQLDVRALTWPNISNMHNKCDQRHSDDCRDEIELFCQSMHVQNGVRMFHLISGGIQHFLLLIL